MHNKVNDDNFIVYFIDALGYDIISKAIGFQNLSNDIRIEPAKSILSYSCGIYPSLWTGTYPDEHRIWNQVFKSNSLNLEKVFPFQYKLLNLVPNRLQFYLIAPFAKISRMAGLNVNYPLGLVTNHWKTFFMRPHSPEYSITVSRPNLFSKLEKEGVKWKFYDITYQNGSLSSKLLSYEGLIILFSSKIDHYGHIYGPNEKKFINEVKKEVYKINFLAKMCRKQGKKLLVLSDHSIQKKLYDIDVVSLIKLVAKKFGYKPKNLLIFADATMVRIWFLNQGIDVDIHEDFINEIRALSNNSFFVLNQSENRKFGVPIPSPEYGDLLIVANIGFYIFPNHLSPPYFSAKIKGLHGYLPNNYATRGIIGTNSWNWRDYISPKKSSKQFSLIMTREIIEKICLNDNA